MTKLDTRVTHHPVVLEQFAKRQADVQLRVADKITGFAGSMQFVYLHALVFAAWMLFVDAVHREEPVADADPDRLPRGDLPLDVRDDRPEPSSRLPTAEGRQRLLERGQAAGTEHGTDPPSARLDEGAAPARSRQLNWAGLQKRSELEPG